MSQPSDEMIVKATWEQCQLLLPAPLRSTLRAVSTDPKRLRKENLDVMRLRVLPVDRKPNNFWDTAWSFYEITVGMHDGSPLILGRVEFFQASKFTNYRSAVLSILTSAQRNLPTFSVTTTRHITLQRTYRSKDYKVFPVQVAAQDFASLITETLQKFCQLPPAL